MADENQISAQEVDTQRLKTYYRLSNICIKVEQGIAALKIGTREVTKEQTRQRIVEMGSKYWIINYCDVQPSLVPAY